MGSIGDLAAIVSSAPKGVLDILRNEDSTPLELDGLSKVSGEQETRKICRELHRQILNNPHLFWAAKGLAFGLRDSGDRSEVIVASAPIRIDQRETAGAVASIIGAALESIDICTFVISHIDELQPLFESAVNRGVRVRLLVDIASLRSDDGRKALRNIAQVSEKVEIRVWNGSEKESTLHAKFLLVDSNSAFVTSANITGRALTNNVELGVILMSNPSTRSIALLFDRLWTSDFAMQLDAL